MIKIKTFVFNSFQVNTYLLINDNNEGLIIDAANYTPAEDQELLSYIRDNNIQIRKHLLTHAHVDHILGADFVEKTFNVKPATHKDSMFFWNSAEEFASVFGIEIRKPSAPNVFYTQDDEFSFGNEAIKVIHAPGHADGSLCYYFPESNMLFTGDVLFASSIGRTDLPTGNMETLLRSVREKLFVLPDETMVYPGHGPSTTIGDEKRGNPFL